MAFRNKSLETYWRLLMKISLSFMIVWWYGQGPVMGKGCRFSASAQEVHAPHTKKTNKRKRNPFAVFAVLLRCCAFAAFVALLRCSAFVALLRCCAFAALLRVCCVAAFAVLLRACRVARRVGVAPCARALQNAAPAWLGGSTSAARSRTKTRNRSSAWLGGITRAERVKAQWKRSPGARPRPGEFFGGPQIGAGRESTPPNLHAGRGGCDAVLRATSLGVASTTGAKSFARRASRRHAHRKATAHSCWRSQSCACPCCLGKCPCMLSLGVFMARSNGQAAEKQKKLTPVLGRTFAGPGLHYSWGGVFAWVTFQVRSPEKLFGYREIKA